MLVAADVMLRFPDDWIMPPVRVRPLDDRRPEVPAEIPPVNVEVAVPTSVRMFPPVMFPVMWRVEEALSASDTERVPAMVDEADETNPLLKWKARASEADVDAV